MIIALAYLVLSIYCSKLVLTSVLMLCVFHTTYSSVLLCSLF